MHDTHNAAVLAQLKYDSKYNFASMGDLPLRLRKETLLCSHKGREIDINPKNYSTT